MRPIEIYLEGFGQYAKPQTVRFDRLEPLFLITGPTGAGKTTLFDAMSYALYGKGLSERASPQTLRSELVGEEQSTIVRFRFTMQGEVWEVERSPYTFVRRRRTGTIESAVSTQLRRVLPNGTTQAIEPVDVEQKLNEILLISHEDFSKILVLPQGKFQEFLTMKSDKRGDLLSDLFPVEAHETVAKVAKTQALASTSAFNQLQAIIDAEFQDFPHDDYEAAEAARDAEVLALAALEAACGSEHAEAVAALTDARQLASDTDNLRLQLAEQVRHEATRPEYATKLARRDRAQTAATLAGSIEAFRRVSDEIDRLDRRLKDAERVLTEAQGAKEAPLEASLELPERKQRLADVRRDAEAAERHTKSLGAARDADTQWRQALEATTQAETELTVRRAEHARREAALARLDDIAHQRDAHLPHLQSLYERKLYCESHRGDAETAHLWFVKQKNPFEKQLTVESTTLTDLERRFYTARATLDAALTDLRDQAAALVAATLTPGAPCPACGSADHPHPFRGATGDGDRGAAVRNAQAEVNKQQTTVHEQQGIVARLRASRDASEAQAQAALDRLTAAGFADLEAYGIEKNSVVAEHTAAAGAATAFEQQLAGRAAAVAARDQAATAVTAHEPVYRALADEAAVSRGARDLHWTQVGSPADLEAALADAQSRYEAHMTAILLDEHAIQRIELAWSTAERNVADAEGSQRGAAEALTEKQGELPPLRESLDTEVRRLGFIDAAEASAAMLLNADMIQLQEEINKWQIQEVSLNQTIADLSVRTGGRPVPDLAERHARVQALEQAHRSAIAEHTKATGRLVTLREQAKALESRRAELRVLRDRSHLHLTLSKRLNGEAMPRIGFARWMLMWWLEQVLAAGNDRLSVLSEGRHRFVLRREAQKGTMTAGLDIDIHDGWTNTSRSADQLSGGEKFLAALALALGLSDVVQRTNGGVQLDTLFIDEGFGSLDADTLERTMELILTIAKHRSVGLISHVEAMKRAIPSQIQVSKSPTGSLARVISPTEWEASE